MTKAERTRLVAWRFKILQHGGAAPRNVARTCRYFGISRKTFYKWKGRYDAHREAGLCDRPRAPHRSPRSTPSGVVSKILYLRQTYHFGPRRIADYLKRFHGVSLAMSSVHRILVRVFCKHIGTAYSPSNGAEFQSQFHWHAEGLDIRHVYIRPRTPHLNGKVERSHRVDDEEFYQLLDKRRCQSGSVAGLTMKDRQRARRMRRPAAASFETARHLPRPKCHALGGSVWSFA